MLERVARDQVIRGYFSDEEKDEDLSFIKSRHELFDSPSSLRRSSSFDPETPTLPKGDQTGT